MRRKVAEIDAATTLAAALQESLRRKAWTQAQLAEFLGRDHSTVSLYCSGKSNPKVSDRPLVEKLSTFLEVPREKVEALIRAPLPPVTAKAFAPEQQVRLRTTEEIDGAVDLDVSASLLRLREEGHVLSFLEVLRENGYDTDPALLEEYLAPHRSGRSREVRRAESLNRFSPAGPPDTMLAEYRSLYSRDLGARDVIRVACRALDRRFATSPGNELTREEVHQCLFDVLGPALDERARENHASAVLAMFVKAKLIEPTAQGTFRRLWQSEFESPPELRLWGRAAPPRPELSAVRGAGAPPDPGPYPPCHREAGDGQDDAQPAGRGVPGGGRVRGGLLHRGGG